ncbi:L10-interacting MYB domain-containing protein, partial [Actinidia chinensis var. chinensis]
LRSGWTPPMDRYFIDLMLEQIRRGNMVDQNFNEQAWSDMVVKFVVEFGSQHDKDGLKSRFEDMKNLFLDVRTLTDQNGFAWDEMQQMITASGDIWDDYIKDKPEAQSYRSRTLPNYNDLFLIYGNTSINGRRDFASCCTDLDDDSVRENIRQEDDQSSSGSDTLSIAWTKPMDRYFIGLMLGQVLEGNKVDDSFSKQAWSCMMTSLNEKFGLQFDKCVLENRYLSLMDQYDNVNTFFYQNGFAWNEIQQKLTADDLVWEAYIEEHPDAKVYKDIILENYSDLSVIFGDESHDDKSSYVCPEMGFDYNALEMGMDGVFGALQSLARDIEVSNVRKRPRSTIATHGRKLQKTSDELQEAGRSNTAEKNCISIERIVDALQAVPDMDDELFLDACDLLEDEKKAKAFVKMDIPRRKKWLLRNLRA